MGKFGRKNEIKIDPLAYNIGLIGESGIGKTTVIKEMCEKLVGDDGYMFLEMGHEDGADSIQGISSINCPKWSMDEDEWEYDKDGNVTVAGFVDVIDDVIENKFSDYPDVKVIIIDTIDQLFEIAEPEVIRLHNNENPEKRATSIKAAFGGFMAGEDKAIEIVLDKLWSLKKVGVAFIVIGHTKKRDIEDPVTGQTYSILTTNMSNRYFNAIKTKLHFLGVASVDRKIVKEKTGKKNVVTKKEEEKGRIVSEARKITFRDNDYSIDSKSRFSEIALEIPLDSDELINALTNAIKAEQAKSGKSFEQTKAEQEKTEIENLKAIAEKAEKNKAEKELKAAVDTIITFIKENKSNMDAVKPIMAKSKELGYAKPTDIDNMDDANTILQLIS